jgi:hypothetical protein
VRAITVSATRSAQGSLSLRYEVTGELAGVRWPAVTASERTDELWRRTCLEAFIRSGDEPGYVEANLSPSTQWALYRFDAYRAGMRAADDIAAARIVLERTDERFELSAEIALGDARGWRLAATAVIEEADGRLSYWSLAHPAGRPDFHHADNFILDLSPDAQ